jgi:chaperone modulatory protein CbpM
MIDMEILMTRVSGVDRSDVERWIGASLVYPDFTTGRYAFQEIDVARVRLIQELRRDMQVNEEALPIVLSLLDQLYDLRRRMRDLGSAMREHLPEDTQQVLIHYLKTLQF